MESTIPKLSEAILLGSIGTEQAFGILKDNDGRTCAMGGAYVAASVDLMTDVSTKWLKFKTAAFIPLLWKWAFKSEESTNEAKWYKCPKCGGSANTVVGVIIHLNDQHRMPRPMIAEYVAQQEAIFEAETVKTPQAVDTLPALTSCR